MYILPEHCHVNAADDVKEKKTALFLTRITISMSKSIAQVESSIFQIYMWHKIAL